MHRLPLIVVQRHLAVLQRDAEAAIVGGNQVKDVPLADHQPLGAGQRPRGEAVMLKDFPVDEALAQQPLGRHPLDRPLDDTVDNGPDHPSHAITPGSPRRSSVVRPSSFDSSKVRATIRKTPSMPRGSSCSRQRRLIVQLRPFCAWPATR